MFSGSTKTDLDFDLSQKTTEVKRLVLYNDDVNTFDHVIESLVKICAHQPEQAEQCAYIIHYKGKCIVKSGEFKKLRPMCEALLERSLTAAIE